MAKLAEISFNDIASNLIGKFGKNTLKKLDMEALERIITLCYGASKVEVWRKLVM